VRPEVGPQAAQATVVTEAVDLLRTGRVDLLRCEVAKALERYERVLVEVDEHSSDRRLTKLSRA
jgi:hypothetical protein